MKPIRVLSLGAGVQSTTIALMIEKGELPPVDAAIFSDTQAEPASVYEHLWKLAGQLSYPLFIVSAGDLGAASTDLRVSKKSGKRYMRSLIPAFVLAPDGSKGLLGRKCTMDFKITPIWKQIRVLLGMKAVRSKSVLVEQLIGISTDEAHRMKHSQVTWITHSYPLIDSGMSRSDCLKWMKVNGYPEPPRSSCYFCPFHGDEEWRRLRDNEPEEFARAVEFEKHIQEVSSHCQVLKGKIFLHSSCRPLNEVDLDKAPSHMQLSLFGNECSGMCGV